MIAVGGTALSQASNSRGWTETAWSGTGSGCSAFEPKPSWQTDSGCAKRTDVDVSAVASPQTPLSVADSYKLPSEYSQPEAGWTLVGGTSASSPLVAGMMALSSAYTRSFPAAEPLYKEAAQNGTGVLDDVTSGSNVRKKETNCGTYLCNAGPGYDGPTGLGSIYGAPIVLPNAPAVVTEKASAITQTSATLNATVNPNGGEVSECDFEYGPTTSYGSTAPCSSAPGSGSSPVSVSAARTGLAANTTYHFRISAKNAGGTSEGSDETFKTSPGAPIVTTGAASSVAQTSATLNATVNPNGAEVSSCELEYGTSTAYGKTATCTPAPGSGSGAVAVSATIAGLSAGTTYHFRVVAANSSGKSEGSDETFKTAAAQSPPTVVTGTASPLTATLTSVNATVNPNGFEVTSCKLEYGTTSAYGSSASCEPVTGAGSAAVAVSASLTGLSPNTTYHFRISATNSGGPSSGSDAAFTTPSAGNAHWYANGDRTEEGKRVPYISWGRIALTGSKAGAATECQTALAGYVENPPGAGVGAFEDEGAEAIEAFDPYNCTNPECEADGGKAGVLAEDLPWAAAVSEEVKGAPRLLNAGVQILIHCSVTSSPATEQPGTGAQASLEERKSIEYELPGAATCTTSAGGSLKPRELIGSSPGKPSKLEFSGSTSGELECAAAGKLAATGILKLLGFEESELLMTKHP